MVVKTYTNNNAKMSRAIKAAGQESDYAEFNALLTKRGEEWRDYFSWRDRSRNKMVQYIKFYKKNRLIGLKQIYYSPIDYSECWEIREKDLIFTHTIGRESGIKGIEALFTNYLAVRYKNLQVVIGNRLFEVYRLGDIYNEVFRFFKLLTNYSREFPIEKIIVETKEKKKKK